MAKIISWALMSRKAIEAMKRELRTLETELRTKAAEYLKASSPHKGDSRAALVKGAAVMRMDADRIASIIAKHSEPQHAPAVAEIPERTQAPHWPLAASAEPSHQDAGHVDLSGVQAGDGYA